MRKYEEYQQILELWESGMAKKRIAITLGIPRATVRDCIDRFGSVKGLEENKERALRSTPDPVLMRIRDAANTDVQSAYAYVLGIYLGDGSISIVRKVHRLRVTLDKRYPMIIQTCSEAIQRILPDNQVGIVQREGCVDVSCFHKFWPDILPQHGLGKKH